MQKSKSPYTHTDTQTHKHTHTHTHTHTQKCDSVTEASSNSTVLLSSVDNQKLET